MIKKPHSRRTFLRQSGTLIGGSWVAAHLPLILAASEVAAARQAEGAQWQHLTESQALTLSMVADQVFPPDDTPGAAEIGAVHFMDEALGGFMASALPLVQAGCTDLDQRAISSGQAAFADLQFHAQTAVLKQIEQTPFFGVAHMLTLCGVFTHPRYGGNREAMGWQLIGFEPRHAWQPPFGFYDAQEQASDHETG